MATVLKGETRTPEDIMEETDTNRDGFMIYKLNIVTQDIQIKHRNPRYTN
jgi:hypothetical protein